MKNSLPPCLFACLIARCLSASVPTTDWRLTGGFDKALYDACHPGVNDLCAYPYYEVSVPNDGVPVPITNPLVIYTVAHAENYKHGFTFDEYPMPTSNCTFTLEDGFQFETSGSYELIPQAVTSISCVPIGGDSSSQPMPTAPSTVPAGGGQVPPYPTAPSNSSAAMTGTTAVASTGAPTNTAVAPTGDGNLVPFTGGASTVRAWCSIPILALVLGFLVHR